MGTEAYRGQDVTQNGNLRGRVVVISQPGRTDIHLAVLAPIELGRDCEGLLLADGQVSRRHLKLEPVDGRVIATDLGSTNGTTLDGQPITSPVVLSESATLVAGETTIRLWVDRSAPRPTFVPDAGLDPRATQTATPVVRPDPGVPDDIRATSIQRVAESIEMDKIDVAPLVSGNGTITIVFSDIESSTERNVALGDQVWFEVLGKHNDTVRKHLARYGGTEIKNQGDGYMLSFPGARMAVDCMVAVQAELEHARTIDPERSVRVRVGMHTGEALVDDDGDLFGQHVVIAARVANLASGGEILLSQLTHDIVAARGDMVFGEARSVELKGISGGPHDVYPVYWEDQRG